MILMIDSTPKSLLEAMYVADTAMRHSEFTAEYLQPFLQTIRKIMEECERMRPIGPDGKHDNLHTLECGCEDKGRAWNFGYQDGLADAQQGYHLQPEALTNNSESYRNGYMRGVEDAE